MIKSSYAAVAAAVFLGTVAYAGSASALTVPMNSAGGQFAVSSDVDTVSHRKWDHRRHGARHRHKHGKFVHFHGGHYYATPWWTVAVPLVPTVSVGIPVFGTPEYHTYCKRKFKGYNPRTGMYRKGSKWVRCG